MIRAGFVGLDGNMEEAAQVMGAKPLYTLRKVILPIIMPIVLSVIVLNFNGILIIMYANSRMIGVATNTLSARSILGSS